MEYIWTSLYGNISGPVYVKIDLDEFKWKYFYTSLHGNRSGQLYMEIDMDNFTWK